MNAVDSSIKIVFTVRLKNMSVARKDFITCGWLVLECNPPLQESLKDVQQLVVPHSMIHNLTLRQDITSYQFDLHLLETVLSESAGAFLAGFRDPLGLIITVGCRPVFEIRGSWFIIIATPDSFEKTR